MYLGSAYVNDFNMFGRTFRVTAQADGEFRIDRRTSRASACATTDGPDGAARQPRTFHKIAGPDRMPRYNLFPTAEVNGTTAPGVSIGQALEIMARARRA